MKIKWSFQSKTFKHLWLHCTIDYYSKYMTCPKNKIIAVMSSKSEQLYTTKFFFFTTTFFFLSKVICNQGFPAHVVSI